MIKKLICRHKWQLIGSSSYNNMHSHIYNCKKCDKIKNLWYENEEEVQE